MSLSVIQIPVGGYDDNFSYLIHDESTNDIAIVDPSGDMRETYDIIEDRESTVMMILITHTHQDHYDALSEVLKRYPTEVCCHTNATDRIDIPTVTYIDEESTITLGNNTITTMYTPGHIDDAVCFFISKDNTIDKIPKLITGDTIFVEGCGRTNEQGVKDLYESIQLIKKLPDETEIYPGHNYGSKPHSTLEYEKTHNKYFLVKNFKEFKKIRLG